MHHYKLKLNPTITLLQTFNDLRMTKVHMFIFEILCEKERSCPII